MRKLKLTTRTLVLISAVGAALGLSACGMIKHSEPEFIFMPDMVYSPAFKAQEGQMRVPPKGTVPVNHDPYDFPGDAEGARSMKNPLPRTREVMARGKLMFETYCLVCHGPYGEGDGTVGPLYPRPPSLQNEKVRGWPDGRIFHVVTMGQNLMPSYASQVAAKDRWAIIHYLRAIHRAKNPTAADIQAAERAGR